MEFLQLPEEVLTTTMIHHQHYFPVVDEDGKLKPAFLAVTNMEAEKPEIIARNSERVLTARLRDARFFYDEDRKATLESRIDRLVDHPVPQEARDVSREGGSRRVAGGVDRGGGVRSAGTRRRTPSRPGRLCKADLATDMVRELTELQGTMGGIYAREEGLPEAVWKAIYFHYLPIGVEAEAPPTRQHLGAAAVAWAAVSLADKLDSVVGMFTAGERPTGSRDPLGLRRQAQGAVKILADLPELTGLDRRLKLGALLDEPRAPFGGYGDRQRRCSRSWPIVWRICWSERDFDVRSVRAVMHGGHRARRARSKRAASSRRCRR